MYISLLPEVQQEHLEQKPQRTLVLVPNACTKKDLAEDLPPDPHTRGNWITIMKHTSTPQNTTSKPHQTLTFKSLLLPLPLPLSLPLPPHHHHRLCPCRCSRSRLCCRHHRRCRAVAIVIAIDTFAIAVD
jgi:hypothetical protein